MKEGITYVRAILSSENSTQRFIIAVAEINIEQCGLVRVAPFDSCWFFLLLLLLLLQDYNSYHLNCCFCC
jgi:hypothetical protein